MKSDFFATTSEVTTQFGRELAQRLLPNAVIALYGDLGAGKTTLVKGIVQALTGIDPHEVVSPTFTYLNVYNGRDNDVYHFDLYRLSGEEDFLSLGFQEYLTQEGVCCIEWPERIPSLLPQNTLAIELSYNGEEGRTITMKYEGYERTFR